MVIKLTKPSLSNKKETIPENPDSSLPNEPPSKPAAHPKYTPFIDRITIVVTVPQGGKSDDTGPLAQSMYNAFFTYLDDPELFANSKKTAGYKIAKRLVLGPDLHPDKRPHLQFSYYEGQAFKYRLEFSPAGLGEDGLNQLKAAMVLLMPDGWEFVLKYGRITKIEVSVDLPKVELSSVHPLPQQVTTAKTWGNGGALETLVLGKPKSPQLRIYDRGAKRSAKHQHSPHYEGTRIERILQPKIMMSEVPKLSNPFKSLKLVVLKGKPPEEPKLYVWEMFTDSVRLRTLPVALKLLPEEKRAVYRKWLGKNPLELWKPEEIWSEWPAYLKSTSLFD